MPKWQISYNIVVAFETMHMIEKQSTGSDYFVNKGWHEQSIWSNRMVFSKKLMIKMGFDKNWVELIMLRISTVTYLIFVNDSKTCLIKPKRGLRQRDPLSPYLFLLCSEGLSCLPKKAILKISWWVCKNLLSVVLFHISSLLTTLFYSFEHPVKSMWSFYICLESMRWLLDKRLISERQC